MAIDLKALLHITPFTQEDRDDLLKRIETMDDEQKIRLSNGCWQILSRMHYERLQIEYDKLRREVAMGKREFNKKDFDDAENQLLHELTKQFDSLQSQTEIEAVRQELAKHQKLVGKADYSPKT